MSHGVTQPSVLPMFQVRIMTVWPKVHKPGVPTTVYASVQQVGTTGVYAGVLHGLARFCPFYQ